LLTNQSQGFKLETFASFKQQPISKQSSGVSKSNRMTHAVILILK